MWCILPDFYAENLRNILFTGLLTLGTFLFAVKTFIVVKLKEDVFDQAFYLERVRKMQKLSPGKNIQQYQPLRNLMTVLFYASLLSISSAVLQVTLGLVGALWTTVVCITAAAVSIALLFWAMILVKINLNVWLEELEKNSAARAKPASQST